jgi:hypothetical protein
MFLTVPPDPSPGPRPSVGEQIRAIGQQIRWADQQIDRLAAYRSTVRATAYAPQDAGLAACMDRVLLAVHLGGFGRSSTEQVFHQRFVPARTVASAAAILGFAALPRSSQYVPWFLVSSPSFDAVAGQLRSTPSVGSGDAGPPAGAQPTHGAPRVPNSPTTGPREWWEQP